MKIIQVSPYYPPHVGGAEQRVRDLSERLAKRGNQVEVFTSDIGCPKDKQSKSTKGLEIHYLKAKEFAHTPIILSLFSKLMKTPKDSIMHVHVAQALVPEIVQSVSKIKKTSYIVHIRADVERSGKLGFVLPAYKKIFLKKVLKNASKIIALNEDYRNLISRKYGISKNKIVVIPNATNFKISKTKKRESVKNILFVGRLSVEKNVLKLVEAFSLLKNKDIVLNIVGEGEKREEIENLIKKKSLKNIILHGRKEKQDLVKMYNKADIFLLPSEYECFSSTLLEAMATGTPIIASDVQGTRSVVKNNYNGLLIKPTPEKIAESIKKLIEHPQLRKKLANNGLKEVKKYSWDKIVEQTEQVYREVLKGHNKK
jgi:glycosyltransferase involved in cell wall biosynthesis